MKILLCVLILVVFSSEATKREWASEVTAFSSQYSSTSYSAKQILGKPNVYPKYSQSSLAWTQAYRHLDANQYIELKFPEKIWLTEVNIYEVYNAGAVKRILAKNEKNGWVEIFKAPYALLIKRSRIFSPKIKRLNFPVNELRIEVDCTASGSYVYIDAVEIVGDDCPRQFQKLGDSCYLIKKDKVSADTAFANCLETGGYLANFETLEEALQMKKLLKKMNTRIHFYVGGRNINRRKPGGDWRWIKHGQMTKMTYHAFGAGEPNGSDRSPQDCMFFYAGERYTFHNVFCDNGSYLGGYICEA
ncbi:uncharacterized protein LOC133173725 [Saccostrea echinata]|uniref:uncharacterized protein LOC133173725 n=1 Tax=Saccostrea echinata TaxID=191078 RepID=UPI002A836DCE|nr:uncharacterized protein LOC133173725 [Saccostrea echinata]